jgi:ParB family chromosome partitioning protein
MARRSGLGKGLGALIPTEVPGHAASALREVPIGSIRPNARQPRTYFDEEAMSSLAASIRELGVLQPVLVKEVPGEPDAYELIAGERRWRAARRAGLQTIPVLAQIHAGDAQSLEQALVENLHREDLNPLEEAAAYQQLIDDFSFTHEQVAKRVGKSRAAVTNTLRLLQLPAGVQRALADATISAGHARALLGTPDRVLQEALVARVISEGLTVRAVEDEVRRAQDLVDAANAAVGNTDGTTSRQPSRRPLPEPGLLELEELLAAFLNTRVKVDLKNRKGRLVIEFATLEDLERIYRTMVGQQSG